MYLALYITLWQIPPLPLRPRPSTWKSSDSSTMVILLICLSLPTTSGGIRCVNKEKSMLFLEWLNSDCSLLAKLSVIFSRKLFPLSFGTKFNPPEPDFIFQLGHVSNSWSLVGVKNASYSSPCYYISIFLVFEGIIRVLFTEEGSWWWWWWCWR